MMRELCDHEWRVTHVRPKQARRGRRAVVLAIPTRRECGRCGLVERIKEPRRGTPLRRR